MPHHKNLIFCMHTLDWFTPQGSHCNAVVLCKVSVAAQGLAAPCILPSCYLGSAQAAQCPSRIPISCVEMPCAEIQLQDYSHSFLWLQCCMSIRLQHALFIQEFCQIFWCLLNYRWNLSFYELWPALKARFCLKIFALLLQLTARLLKLEMTRRSKFPLFSVSLLCICDNTFTQIHCFP